MARVINHGPDNELSWKDYLGRSKQGYGMLWKALAGEVGEITGINIKLREDGLFLIVKRLSPIDGGPEIAFGSAQDMLTMVVELNRIITAGKWRPDEFELKRGNGGVVTLDKSGSGA